MTDTTVDKKYTFYLAGPDVFLPDGNDTYSSFRRNIKSADFKLLSPMDSGLSLPDGMPANEQAMAIYNANIELIKQCDAVLANVNDFRGPDPDSGTAFEIGYAAAIGKDIYLYTKDTRPMCEKIKHHGTGICDDGWMIEDFGLPVNLMLACASKKIYRGHFHLVLADIYDDIFSHKSKPTDQQSV